VDYDFSGRLKQRQDAKVAAERRQQEEMAKLAQEAERLSSAINDLISSRQMPVASSISGNQVLLNFGDRTLTITVNSGGGYELKPGSGRPQNYVKEAMMDAVIDWLNIK
jgi:hypothetical protein